MKGTFWFDNTILDFMKTHFFDSLNNKLPYIAEVYTIIGDKQLKSKALFKLFFEYFQ